MWLVLAVACLIQQAVISETSTCRRHQNPQAFMNISEIIQFWGYTNQQYEILTDDGYYLMANRIPSGIHNSGKTGPRPVALLVSGVITEGRSWIANLPNNSLGFFLAEAGYDVWIINNRGTTWSRRHQKLTNDQEEFWDFSFHEMGIYDIPATINFILKKTKQDSLYYIGHSQGASLGLITLSIMPHLAQKIKLLMCFAPPYTLEDIKGPGKMIQLFSKNFKRCLYGNKEFQFVSRRIKTVNAKLCSFPGIDKLCIQLIFFCSGFNKNGLNESRADVYFGIYPDYTSMKTMLHWSQVLNSNEFKYFDFGKKNKDIYNMTKPPFYKIEDATVPTAVWNGGNDFIVRPKNIQKLLPRLTNLVFHRTIPDWQHADFIWGLDGPNCLYPELLYLMYKYK